VLVVSATDFICVASSWLFTSPNFYDARAHQTRVNILSDSEINNCFDNTLKQKKEHNSMEQSNTEQLLIPA
jgi:hypothetical protein